MTKLTKYLLASAILGACGAVQAQNAETIDNSPPGSFIQPVEGTTIWPGPSGNVLFDNGPLVNGVGTGSGGADESILQSSLGMTTLGAGHQLSAANSVIDDFTVPAGGWQVDEMVFFAYQTNSSTTSTITGVGFQVWDGDPSVPGSSVIFGDLATNVLVDTAWSGIYRVDEGTTGSATNRPIMANTVAVNAVLEPGTYWVEWQSDGSLGSGPWAPPITIDGEDTTGNALQNLDTAGAGSIAPLLDTGSTTPQGLPFIVVGTPASTQAVPTLGPVGLGLLLMLMMGVAVVALRRV